MIHKMKLRNEPFELIKNKIKTIELRLNDEKRQLINVGDVIEFENIITLEKIKVRVMDIYRYDSFKELYKNIDKLLMGYREEEEACFSDMDLYYSKEEQEKYGVLGIGIELVDNFRKEIINNNDNIGVGYINKVVRRSKILFVNDNELMLCFSNNNYFLLGGHNEENETDMDCLHREVLEETGVELNFDDLDSFMIIKYFNKDYPSKGVNTLTIANYYVLNYNLIPNYENSKLTEEEKNGNFKIVKINKNDVIRVLEDSLEFSTRKNVTLDTIEVIKEYLEENELD